MKRISRMLFWFELVCMRCCPDKFCGTTRLPGKETCEPTLQEGFNRVGAPSTLLACVAEALLISGPAVVSTLWLLGNSYFVLLTLF